MHIHILTHSQLLSLVVPPADGAGGRGKCTVSLHQHLRRNSCHFPHTQTIKYDDSNIFRKAAKKKLEDIKTHTSFQPVDVLRVHPQQLLLLVEQSHKIMSQVGLIVPRVQLFGQGEERIWVVMEKADLEYGLGVRQVVLLQVVIETAAWRPVRGDNVLTDPQDAPDGS